MKIINKQYWTFYVGSDTERLLPAKCGKWMYFFNFPEELEFVRNICLVSVKTGVVVEAKHSSIPNNREKGVACFYLNIDDHDGHRKVIKYFLDNNLIKQTQSGVFHNISFKLDSQTLSGDYGRLYSASNYLTVAPGWAVVF